ncbi:hypothetical protein JYK21_01140 [Ralstonia pickettii]|nr:hypothetical protein [Ralstonia pickettii]
MTITRVTPDQLGYKDRGIVKWLGMMLSDHSEALKKEKAYSQMLDVAAKEEMTETEISQVLHKAFINNSPVLIQANVMRNGSHYQDLKCKVIGYTNGKIYLKLKDGRKTSCTIEDIRNLEFMNALDWHDKRK